MASGLHLTPARRLGAFLAADVTLVLASVLVATLLRFEGAPPPGDVPIYILNALWLSGLFVAFGLLLKAYRASWSYVDLRDIARVAGAVGLATSVSLGIILALRGANVHPTPSLGVNLIQAPIAFCAIAGFRLAKRAFRLVMQGVSIPAATERVLIIGGGSSAAQIVKSIIESTQSPRLQVVGMVDDDPLSWGTSIHGARVLGPLRDLDAHLTESRAQTVIICNPSATRTLVQETMRVTRRAGITKVRIVPTVTELVGDLSVQLTRAVTLEDLLGRDSVQIDLEGVRQVLAGRSVLVTGGAGTIGSELCRQLARAGVAKLVVLDVDETRLHDVALELHEGHPHLSVVQALIDVRDRAALDALFAEHDIRVVFHAAAYKHVPMMESYPLAALDVNVIGTWNVLQAAQLQGSERFVLISTDKAVEPTSVMGASKRLAEIVLFGSPPSATRIAAVRFGNVLGSRGSVLTVFERQLKQGGPLTVTHPAVERYFMMTSEAVQLVLQSSGMGESRDVFVLDMGKPVRILDVAREFIRMHGLEPEKDVKIVITGLRSGEKLTESLHHQDEILVPTAHPRVSKTTLRVTPRSEEVVAAVAEVVSTRDHAEARSYLERLFPSLGGGRVPRAASAGSPAPESVRP